MQDIIRNKLCFMIKKNPSWLMSDLISFNIYTKTIKVENALKIIMNYKKKKKNVIVLFSCII